MRVLNEMETLDLALRGRSIARFGDAELRLAVGTDCPAQKWNPRLREELVEILGRPSDCLVCIPKFDTTPRKAFWKRFQSPKYVGLMRLKSYGSSFITRPDNAPHINRPEYWAAMRRLWAGKDVVLVSCGKRDLGIYIREEAASVRHVRCTAKNAYHEVDRLEAEVGRHRGPVILNAGACATVLAWRMSVRGILAFDLGHVGVFMQKCDVARVHS